MDRSVFKNRIWKIVDPMSEQELKGVAYQGWGDDREDAIISIEELSELQKEVTKQLRGKGNKLDFLQELAHAQICIWRLQAMYHVSDEELRRGIQASIRILNRTEEQ